MIENARIPNDMQQGSDEAWISLFLLGLAFRFFAWLLLALIKFAEGGGFFTDLCFVFTSGFMDCLEYIDCFDLFQIGLMPDRADVDLDDLVLIPAGHKAAVHPESHVVKEGPEADVEAPVDATPADQQ